MDLLEQCGCVGGIVRARNDSGAKAEQFRLKTTEKNPIEQALPELWIRFSLAVRDSLSFFFFFLFQEKASISHNASLPHA